MAENRLCLIQRLTNRAITQCNGYDFQSLANVGGRLFGVNESGIFEIGVGDDFAGTAIAAWAALTYDFQQLVKARSMWFGFDADGDLSVRVMFDKQAANANTSTLTPKHTDMAGHGAKVYFERDDQGQYMEVRISNVDGSDFSLNSIQGVMVPLGRRR